ncbi:MAG: hypothetical protein R3B13_26155 [Polyangiaceae bacterium]
MKASFTVVSAVAVLCVAPLAGAQEEGGAKGLGKKGNLILGAERLMGYTSNTQNIEVGGNEAETTYGTLGVLWNQPRSPFNLPRIGIDYFVIDNVSVGGNIGYVSTSIDAPGNGDDDSSGFLFSPRAGYMLGLGESLGFWPRLGLTYYQLQDPDASQFALSADLQIVVAPSPGFAITAGPVVDFGLTGSIDTPAGDADYTDRNFGFVFGIAGVL